MRSTTLQRRLLGVLTAVALTVTACGSTRVLQISGQPGPHGDAAPTAAATQQADTDGPDAVGTPEPAGDVDERAARTVRRPDRGGCSATTRPHDAGSRVFSHGDSGPNVRALQERLTELGYWLGEPDGDVAAAETPTGTWEISWQADGWRDSDLGRLWRPKYFHRDGLAIHGYPDVPAHPDSRGCARVSMEAMDFIWEQDLAPYGTTVIVH